jgi:hypothetical protein
MIKEAQFVVCLNNIGYDVSLEIGKLYQVIPDVEAEKLGCLRVIDEDAEDYLYDAKMFCPIQVPLIVSQTLLSVTK